MKRNNLKLYQRIQKSYRGITVTIVFLIIFVFFATAVNYVDFRDRLVEKEQQQLLTIAKSTAGHLEDFFAEKISDASVLTQIIAEDYNDELAKGDVYTSISRSLEEYLKIQNGKVFEMQYYDEKGRLIFDSIPLSGRYEKLGLAAFPTEIDSNRERIYVGDVFQISPGELAIDILADVHVPNMGNGHLRMIILIDDIYNMKVSSIQVGKKGYASVKDSTGVLIMHPKKEDIGQNVMVARKNEFPDYDWSELEALVEKQKEGEAGTGIYHSFWYQDEKRHRVKKFSAYAPAFIGEDFWVVTVSMDYKELSDLATNYFYTNIILAGVIPLLLILLMVYIFSLKKTLRFIENEQKYIEKVENLNKELARDIEERKVLESALYASKERFKQLFNAGSDLIFVLSVIDDYGRYEIVRLNDIACKRLGRERKEIVGIDFKEIIQDISKEQLEMFMDKVASGEEYIHETVLTLDEGNQVPVEIAAQIFTLEGQKMIMLMTRDITKKKLEEEQLEKNRALLIYKFRLVAMGEMIANITHQWRQPLGRLSLIISNLQDAFSHDDLSPEYFEEVVGKSRSIIQEMSAVIDDFRYFFNPIQERALFNPERQINTALEMVRDRIKIDEVDVTLESDDNYTVYGYPNQFSQVILNILNNSLDAMANIHEKQRKITICLESLLDHRIQLSIKNNGEPLPEGLETKVFDPYFSTKKDKDGTGIGLYMTKMIIETNFNGTIQMQNEAGFVVTQIIIPVDEVRDNE
ncbi:MAG: sensor histidine kinase [Clostridia bacterium]|nr:sensor histidine kinase [Clostridia bacterium]